MLLQKSRVQWLTVGDGNTKYFYNKVKDNWNTNKIISLQNDCGVTDTGHEKVGKIAVSYFKNSLGTDNNLQGSIVARHGYILRELDDLQLPTVPNSSHEGLVAPVSDELIYNTLKSLKRSEERRVGKEC